MLDRFGADGQPQPDHAVRLPLALERDVRAHLHPLQAEEGGLSQRVGLAPLAGLSETWRGLRPDGFGCSLNLSYRATAGARAGFATSQGGSTE